MKYNDAEVENLDHCGSRINTSVPSKVLFNLITITIDMTLYITGLHMTKLKRKPLCARECEHLQEALNISLFSD